MPQYSLPVKQNPSVPLLDIQYYEPHIIIPSIPVNQNPSVPPLDIQLSNHQLLAGRRRSSIGSFVT